MKIKSLLVFTFAYLLLASKVLAVDVPNFPQCRSYSGQSIVNYSSGVHGIVGLGGEYIGSDVVYTIGDGNIMQCFCAVTGSGIQTNWWKQSSLTEDQINTLKNAGWIFVPSGEPWGLSDTPYFAQNSYYNCGPIPTPTNPPHDDPNPPVCNSAKPGTPALISVTRNGGSATLVWTPVQSATHYTIGYGLKVNDYIYGVPNTGNVNTYTINALNPNTTYYFAVKAVNECTPGDFSGSTTRGGGQVLGLATTGTLMQIIGLLTIALVLLVSALYVRKNQSSHSR